MNRILKFKQTEEQKVFFTSDWHAFHNRDFVWGARGFKSKEEHTQFIIDKTNEIVRENDILFNLGDMTLNCSESMFEEFLSQIKCQNVYTLWGNHNSPSWSIYQEEISKIIDTTHFDSTVEIYPFRYRNLIFIGNYAEVVVDDQYVILNHYAMNTFNYMKDGSWMCHGHSHGNLKTSLSEEIEYGKILDLSWDIFKKPVSFNELKSIMGKKKIIIVDHHQKEKKIV